MVVFSILGAKSKPKTKMPKLPPPPQPPPPPRPPQAPEPPPPPWPPSWSRHEQQPSWQSPPPPPPSERPLWPAYVAGSVGALGFVTFGAVGLLSNSKFSKLEDQCNDNVCPASLEGKRDAGQIYQTVANVGLVIGAVGAATAVVFVLTSGPSAEEEGSGVSAQVALGPRQIALSGSF